MVKHKYIKVPDSNAGDQHKCAVCCITQQCICNIDYQKEHGIGDCSKGYYYEERK